MAATGVAVARPSINARAAGLVDSMVADADVLRVGVAHSAGGALLIDAGSIARGGVEAGRRMVEICLGGLGWASIGSDPTIPEWPWSITVWSGDPVTACLASQYAGWSLSEGEGRGAYHVLGSGPGRAIARREPLFAELGYSDDADRAVFVLEADHPPPEPLIARIAAACGLDAGALTFVYAPTSSLAGATQVVGRVLEVALHKAHALRFPLDRIVDGMGTAPLSPPAPKFVTAMGRTNDAIIYGGRCQLFVTGADDDARDLAAQLPSSGSRDHGRPFAEIFAGYNGDFYKMDPMLFSPAEVVVTALDSGHSFRAGGIDAGLLAASFK